MNYYNPTVTNPYIYQGPAMPALNQQAQQIQNGGLVNVNSEQEAKNYLVAPGNSVTFKDDSAPYIYVKTMGFSQFDTPEFKKFKLIEEVEKDPEKYANAAETEDLRKLYDDLKDQVKILKKTVSEMLGDKDD